MAMKNPVWAKVIMSCADPQRATRFLELLAETDARATLEKSSEEQARVLAAVLGGSQFLGDLLVANPGWLTVIDVERIQYPRRDQGFRGEVTGLLKVLLEARDFAGALRGLRRFKQREMLRIGARDLARISNVVELTRELSDVADVCLDTVWRICQEQLVARFGQPYHEDASGEWLPTPFCVLGMGKLGGQELNFSSDVDLLFVYGDEGQVFKEAPTKKKLPPGRLSNHQFFSRLAESFVAEVGRITPDGMLYRVDMRLRPEGDAGPLCRSLGSYENYYAQWGQTWERMMLIKARGVAGDAALASEFLETIQAFRYPRFVSAGVLQDVAAVKKRIEKEIVGAEELDRNVKLGRGGIREVEFIAQALQLLHAGRQPFLQGGETLPCLMKLAQYDLLSGHEAERLSEAYRFLRDVEHRLQMEANLQTHTIPTHSAARERLARLMGFDTRPLFDSVLQAQTGNVREIYDRLLQPDNVSSDTSQLPAFEGGESKWLQLLSARSFRDPDKAYRLLKEFAEGPGFVHVSPRTTELAYLLIPKLLALCPLKSSGGKRLEAKGEKAMVQRTAEEAERRVLSDPDRVVSRLDSYIAAYGTRAALFEVWNSNPSLFELLLLLFDRSEFLAEAAIRTPDLVDDLVSSGRLRQRKTAVEILDDLRHGAGDDDQFTWMRRYHETELLRLGSRDILRLVDYEQNFGELSALADACLQYALEAVMRKHKIKRPPFVIVGLGKLGGCEINYGSDLDIVFVAEPKAKSLPRLQKLAVEVMELMSRRTEQGIVFHTDARLRPDGEKGLLVNTLDAYEEYYRERAQLWEIQSLTRVRAVAGNLKLGGQYQEMAAALTDFRAEKRKAKGGKGKTPGTIHLSCYTPDWKKQIHQMRMRIEKERTPRGQDDLAIKTGKGGLMDAEFVAQTLCLEHGWQEAHTLRALERGRDAGILPEAEKLLANYRQLRRLEGILRRWSYEGETVLPDDPAPYYRVSVRCGFSEPEAFREALAQWRKGVREAYGRYFDAE